MVCQLIDKLRKISKWGVKDKACYAMVSISVQKGSDGPHWSAPKSYGWDPPLSPQVLYNFSYIFPFKPPKTYVLSLRVAAPRKVKAHHGDVMWQEIMYSIEWLHATWGVSMHVDHTWQLLPLPLFFVRLKVRTDNLGAPLIGYCKIGPLHFVRLFIGAMDYKLIRT